MEGRAKGAAKNTVVKRNHRSSQSDGRIWLRSDSKLVA